jgi:hypothetical protein
MFPAIYDSEFSTTFAAQPSNITMCLNIQSGLKPVLQTLAYCSQQPFLYNTSLTIFACGC